MSEKLKPCPFCGCEDIEHVRANNSLDFSMRIDEDTLICKKCAHAMSDKSAIKLINKWNSRPIEDKFRAWLDRMTAHRKELVDRNVFLHKELKKYKRLNAELVEALKAFVFAYNDDFEEPSEKYGATKEEAFEKADELAHNALTKARKEQ